MLIIILKKMEAISMLFYFLYWHRTPKIKPILLSCWFTVPFMRRLIDARASKKYPKIYFIEQTIFVISRVRGTY